MRREKIYRDILRLFEDIELINPLVLKAFRQHSLRVFYLSSKLARRLGCCDFDLRVGALLHDIGKIGIAPSILFKPGKLTDLEFLVIQSHCHIGNRIVRERLGLKRAAVFVRDHHEWWNGQGYPRGLAGEAITLQARIISVCDAFDTMTIERRYYQHHCFTTEEALEEIRQCAGIQFCPHVAEEFIDMMRELRSTRYQGSWTKRALSEQEIRELARLLGVAS